MMTQKPLPFNTQTLTKELLLKAKRELNEDPEKRKQYIGELRILLRGEPDLNFLDEDDFLLQFLRSRKFNVQRAFVLCRKYYDRRKDPLIGNIPHSVVLRSYGYNFYGTLPYRDSNGCSIDFFSLAKWDPAQVSAAELLQTCIAGYTVSNSFPASQIAGNKIIYDFSGFGLKHLTCLNPRILWRFADNIQNCFPARFRGAHIINQGRFFTYMWSILKTFLKQKFIDRVHLHGTDMQDLHKYLPASILPQECGGDLPPFDSTLSISEFKKFRNQLEKMQGYGYRTNSIET